MPPRSRSCWARHGPTRGTYFKKDANYCNYVVTIADIEQRTGFVFFPALDAPARSAVETQPGKLVDRIGCKVVTDAKGVRAETAPVR